MAYQASFKRWELKYLITREQKDRLLRVMEPYMALDRYGRTVIRNLYFDTDSYRIIRRSREKPVYKEKLRIRSYRQVETGGRVFVELKKKYKGIVYKRRLQMEEQAAMDWLCRGEGHRPQGQISNEIEYFRRFYADLKPKVFLSYEREAYYCRRGGDFRITFDENILCRRESLSLSAPVGGVSLLEEGMVLMEVKTSGGIPLWLTGEMTRLQIRRTPFSKYGKAYETMIYPNCKGDFEYA